MARNVSAQNQIRPTSEKKNKDRRSELPRSQNKKHSSSLFWHADHGKVISVQRQYLLAVYSIATIESFDSTSDKNKSSEPRIWNISVKIIAPYLCYFTQIVNPLLPGEFIQHSSKLCNPTQSWFVQQNAASWYEVGPYLKKWLRAQMQITDTTRCIFMSHGNYRYHKKVIEAEFVRIKSPLDPSMYFFFDTLYYCRSSIPKMYVRSSYSLSSLWTWALRCGDAESSCSYQALLGKPLPQYLVQPYSRTFHHFFHFCSIRVEQLIYVLFVVKHFLGKPLHGILYCAYNTPLRCVLPTLPQSAELLLVRNGYDSVEKIVHVYQRDCEQIKSKFCDELRQINGLSQEAILVVSSHISQIGISTIS